MPNDTSAEMIVVKLYKKINPTNHLTYDKEVFSFDALGYYDEIIFSLAKGAEDLAKITSSAQVGVEQTILLPATSTAFEFKGRFAGGISFILVDEHEDTDLFELAKNIEENLIVNGIELKAYVTMGASAIAIIAFSTNAFCFAKSFAQYLNHLQGFSRHLANQNTIIPYTFTIPLMMPDAFYKALSEQPEEQLEGVYITFSARIEQVNKIDEFLTRVLECICPDKNTLCGKGILAGTDDYYVYAKNVKMRSLVKLFCIGGMLSSKAHNDNWYGQFCNSTLTLISFPICTPQDSKNHDSNNSANVSSFNISFDSKNDNTVDKTYIGKLRHTFERDATIAKNLDAFIALQDSNITQWVYRQYLEIVSLFAELFLEEQDWLRVTRPYAQSNSFSVDSYDFFRLLNQMLEALLNTSAYFTDSPGYRTIENNCLPRLLMCYQRLINKLVCQWDLICYEPEQRKHLFFLYAQDGSSVQAKMFFHKLPPDRRLIGVSVPIYDAYYSATLIPLLLHEAGHYIGVRHRENADDSRVDIFIRLVIDRYFMRLITLTEDKDASEVVHWFHEPDSRSERLTHILFAMYEWYADLYTNLHESYEKTKKQILLDSPADSSERKRRKNKALMANYFSEMSSVFRNIFRYMLQNTPEDLTPPLEEHFSLCIRQYPKEEINYRNYKNSGLKRLHIAMSQVYSDLCGTSSIDFIQESENMLSEVIADIFMVRISEMDVTKYLCLVFERHVNEGYNVDSIARDFEVTCEEIVRVLSVCYAICHGEERPTRTGYNPEHEKELLNVQLKCDDTNAFEDSRLRIMEDHGTLRTAYLSFKRKVYDLYVKKFANHSQQDWVCTLDDIALPYRKVGKYALSIYTDARYESFRGNNNLRASVEKLRHIYSLACSADENEDTVNVYKQIFNG